MASTGTDGTRVTERQEAGPGVSPSAAVPAWRPVAAVAAGTAAVLLLFINEYGYDADELYFRMLGERGLAWGYVDQPPALPAIVRVATLVFGDSLWAIRVPAVLCAVAVVVLGSLIAAEFGASRRAQLMTAIGLGSSVMVLSVGHWILTSSLDAVAWCLVMLFVLRALLRRDGRWWLWAGAACGAALYAKYMVLLLPVVLLLGLVVVGPRDVFRDKRLYLGMALALVIGAPNLVYQITHDFPQIQMARALGASDGSANRSMFVSNLLLLLGPGLAVFWVAGLIGLLRKREWRPVRAVAIGYLLATVAALMIEGGRPDYTGGFLVTLFAVGAVRADRWIARGRRRMPVVAVGLVLTALLQMLLTLPVIPERSLHSAAINSMALETVGWPTTVAQVAAVYDGLSADERARAVLLAGNFGEAGALDRYGEKYGLPAVYSGHNELHNWGPPPDSAEVVVAVGIDQDRLTADFERCTAVARLDNGLDIGNPEQGRQISICQGPRAPWKSLWPAYRHLGAYE
ncbi:glycosyltransferase family 39 protein [Kitasatospora sp. NPDC088779]|uniref:glycosyltransferase family 39 protein n=1 Tax=Kitasatospora sp. NPDC088779 TaxID=3154964 RepID=UPI00344799AF